MTRQLEMTPDISELAQALSKVQGEMQAAVKDKVNPHFKSKYADLTSIWDVARPALSKHGLCVIQATELDADQIIMVTILAHSSGQWLKSYIPLKLSKNDSQGIGAALTYMKRFALASLIGIVSDDEVDDDGETAVGRGKNKEPQKHAVNTEIKNISEEECRIYQNELLLCSPKDVNFITSVLVDKHGITDPRMIPVNIYVEMMKEVYKRRDRYQAELAAKEKESV